MANFWDSEVWSFLLLISVLLISLLCANVLKRKILFLRRSLIPTSVLGGLLILAVSTVFKSATGIHLLNTPLFGGNGVATLEMVTYHCLAIGFIATSFKPSKERINKKRTGEVLDTGLTTVATYLIQGIVGLTITVVASLFVMKDFFPAAGILLPFGYGQGTGQAMNYGNIYEADYGFVGGKSFGLTVAAVGFLCAALGGVMHLHILRRQGRILDATDERAEEYSSADIQSAEEIPMNGSIDKLTVQLGFVLCAYLVAWLVMAGLGALLPGLKSILYGFNFLFGVLVAIGINSIVAGLRRSGLMKRQYINVFLMNRISGFAFDLMIVAGIAAIQLDVLKGYLPILVVLCAAGMAVTYFYVRFVCYKLFPDYREEQFLVMYGMLTGTASTGIILLREIDKDLSSLASENLVYQNLPAIVFGFPMMIIATMAPKMTGLTLAIIVGYFLLLNVVLFRRQLFRKKE